jgi:hypothetical protein
MQPSPGGARIMASPMGGGMPMGTPGGPQVMGPPRMHNQQREISPGPPGARPMVGMTVVQQVHTYRP